MQELALAYRTAFNQHPNQHRSRKEFFASVMGRVPSRAYMSKIARLEIR